MGVRMLVGEADGTTKAAAMYDSSSGWAFGPIFEAEDADDQVTAFLEWLSGGGAVRASANGDLVFRPPNYVGACDPRGFVEADLEQIVKHWRSLYVGEDGWLLDVFECACGKDHHHLGENGETARYGECVYETAKENPCGCRTWRPGNDAAKRAAEGD